MTKKKAWTPASSDTGGDRLGSGGAARSATDDFQTKLVDDRGAARLQAAIDAIEAEFRRYAVHLTAAQRKSTLRIRVGGEDMVKTIMDVAGKHGVEIASHPRVSVIETLSAARRVRPMVAKVAAVASALSDTALYMESYAWSGTLMYYSVLDRVAQKNPELRKEMGPMKSFISKRSSEARRSRTVRKAEIELREAAEMVERAQRKIEGAKGSTAGAGTDGPVRGAHLAGNGGVTLSTGANGGRSNGANGANGSRAGSGE